MTVAGSMAADRLETIAEISRVVSSTLDLGVLYSTIYEQIGRVMDTTQFYIALHDPERGTLEIPCVWESGSLSVNETLPFGSNVTSLVIQQGAALLFNSDDEYLEYAAQNGVPVGYVGGSESEAKIYVPLNTGSSTIGTLTVQSNRLNAYSSEDLQTLGIIASQCAIAIVNARLFARSQDAVGQMQALLGVAQAITGSLELETVLDAILKGLRVAVPYFYGAILLPEEGDEQLYLAGVIGALGEDDRKVIKVPVGTAVTGRVYESGRPVIIPDVRSVPDYIGTTVSEIRSEMAVPLTRGDQVIGVINVERQEVGGFSQSDLGLLSLFASQAAIAIVNARLMEQQQRRVHELQVIQSILQKLSPLHDIATIGELIATELKQLIDYHACRLFTLEPGGKTLAPVYPAEPALQLDIGQGLAGWIVQKGKAVIVPDSLADPRMTYIPGTPMRSESVMGAPLSYEGRVRGVVTLSKLGVDQFDDNSLRLLEIIAGQAALSFDRARLYQELRTQAITDELTQLHNRRHLMARYKEERSRAMRNRHELSAVMLDIDKFKSVNDRFGHEAGDEVLRELAVLIRTTVRTEDIVARYGGEEFCVLLMEVPLEEVLPVAERLREVIEQAWLPRSARVGKITVSVGVAALRATDVDTELFTRADLAMYEAKRSGGNRVCLAGAAEEYRFVDEQEESPRSA